MPNIGQQHSIGKSRQLQRNLYLAAKKDTTRRFYANADTINPLFSNEYDIDWEDDEDLLKKPCMSAW